MARNETKRKPSSSKRHGPDMRHTSRSSRDEYNVQTPRDYTEESQSTYESGSHSSQYAQYPTQAPVSDELDSYSSPQHEYTYHAQATNTDNGIYSFAVNTNGAANVGYTYQPASQTEEVFTLPLRSATYNSTGSGSSPYYSATSCGSGGYHDSPEEYDQGIETPPEPSKSYVEKPKLSYRSKPSPKVRSDRSRSPKRRTAMSESREGSNSSKPTKVVTTPPTKVAVWTIPQPNSNRQSARVPGNEVVPQTNKYHRAAPNSQERSVNAKDERTVVLSEDFSVQGGKYRAVCKLLMGYEDGTYEFMGTGFLISHNTVVTAGHNVIEQAMNAIGKYKAQPIRHATEVRCYIGYAGGDSHPMQLSRRAHHIAVGWEFYCEKMQNVHHPNDFAVITLNNPFGKDVVDPMELSAFQQVLDYSVFMTVPGYPGDKFDGNYMYEGTSEGSATLDSGNRTVLQYKVDTAGGQSGSPVLIAADGTSNGLAVIGVHCFGGDTENFGAMINVEGNNVARFRKALRVQAGHKDDDVVKSSLSGGSNLIEKLRCMTVY